MTVAPLIEDTDFTLHVGDVLDVLRTLPDESVHCVVTSPPYWGLRDYGTSAWEGGDEGCDHLGAPFRTKSKLNENWGAGFSDVKNAEDREPMGQSCSKCGARRVDSQLGLEPTPERYVQNMVAVFREVRRVLRRDGTCWLNIGDSYNAYNGGAGPSSKLSKRQSSERPELESGYGLRYKGLKPKDLVGVPWRLAFALQADGWYLRSDIIWSKPNPMPESVTDRPTKAHEYLFLLAREARYFYDADAVREPHSESTFRMNPRYGTPDNIKASRENPDCVDSREVPVGAAGNWSERWLNPAGRNKRSVWEISTEPYPDAHFATFPQALVEPCVLAGTSERGCCPACGAPWERETSTEYEYTGNNEKDGRRDGRKDEIGGFSSGQRALAHRQTLGWRPTCTCETTEVEAPHGLRPDGPHTPIPCTVLDPFLGSGTTALVTRRLGRRCVGIELSPEYAQLAARRTQQLSVLA